MKSRKKDREGFRSKMASMMREDGKLISYLQNTSHQMRTPITLIRSYTELLLAGVYGPLDSEVKDKMDTISSNLEEMTYFVDQVQDMGHISFEDFEPELKEADITMIVDKIASDISLIGKPRKVTFSLENMEEPHELILDQHLTRRALSHLLRYVVSTAPYGNDIKVALKPGKERTLIIIFGFGQVMDKDQMAAIVKSMSETEARLTTMEWEKLSLPISKALMEMQGGDITILEDESDRTVYVLEFPNR
jgi:two-component system cell cycle sensor histidine kinase PleC